MSPSHGLRFEESTFWVTHRRREYGPFDYAWSPDLGGIELLYCGTKFGEYCSADEIYADLKQFELPMRVVEVSSIVLGCTLIGLLNGLRPPERKQLLFERLVSMGCEKFAEFVKEDAA